MRISPKNTRGCRKGGAFCPAQDAGSGGIMESDVKNRSWHGICSYLFTNPYDFPHGRGRDEENANPSNRLRGMMIAIPVLRSRVAPVLNWCTRIRIFPDDPSYQGSGQELALSPLEAGRRLDFLREQGVKTLICGAASPDLLHYARELGITVVCGVAGELEEVRQSYWSKQLDQPRFWLPGCRGSRRYRSGWRGSQGCPGFATGGGRGRQESQGIKSGKADPWGADRCLCPVCGFRQPHEKGIPCLQVICPRCGQAMVRE